jgi:hypothetical protein
MKTVSLKIRSTTSRVPFRGGSYSAVLEDEDSRDYAIAAGPTRQYDTWAEAARAGLKLADRRGYFVENRVGIERKLTSGTP